VLVKFLRENADIFAWKPSDMPGVPRELAEHSLKVNPTAKPIKQRLRRFAQDRKEAIRAEITKLLAAGFIQEVFHPDWLANPVLVRKKNNNDWRMCVDYTDLNKACPKDPFVPPRIDQVVDSTAGSALLCFLDCYSGYHQIGLKLEDQIKTAFITPFGAFCYNTMAFGLKNAGATYQRTIQACLDQLIPDIVEAYIDDIVVKIMNPEDMIGNLTKVFERLRVFRWKLNPEKCVFGVPSGKLLGFMVSNRGIEANREKITAITKMLPPTCQKDVQKLTGCMAALGRFISRLGVRGLPFFKLLKKQDKFIWDDEAKRSFQELKDYLQSPPILVPPQPREQLYLYISATPRVVSTVLVVERPEEGHAYGVQRPVYFVSEVLTVSKVRYPHVQKLLYGVLISARKLKHYFEAHPISVVSENPLGEILHNRDASGRIVKWSIELAAHHITFVPRTAIKSQVLADFVADWTENQAPADDEVVEYWEMYFDGSLQIKGGGAGVLLISPSGQELKYVLQIMFPVSNNAAEYEAALHGLRIAVSLGIKRLMVRGDSALVINQVNKDWSRTNEKMDAYCEEIRKLEGKFYGLEFHHVVRDHNKAADELAKMGSTREGVPPGVFIQDLIKPSIKINPDGTVAEQQVGESPESATLVVDEALDWRTQIIDYLDSGILPAEVAEDKDLNSLHEQIVRRSKSYVIIGDKLYRRSGVSQILQKCVSRAEGIELLTDIHKGICGNHAGARTIVGKAFRSGFYWPTAVADSENIVRRCKGCQYFARQIHAPAQQLQTIPASWPFACWCLDMIGPFKKAPGGFDHVLVAIDKFTKWIEVKPVRKHTAAKTIEFFTDITHRFGVPNRIITDNGTNFVARSLKTGAARGASSYALHPWRTQGPMAKSKEPMAK